MRHEAECCEERKRERSNAIPSAVFSTILSVVIALQAWILLKIVDGGERMARIEARIETLKP